MDNIVCVSLAKRQHGTSWKRYTVTSDVEQTSAANILTPTVLGRSTRGSEAWTSEAAIWSELSTVDCLQSMVDWWTARPTVGRR